MFKRLEVVIVHKGFSLNTYSLSISGLPKKPAFKLSQSLTIADVSINEPININIDKSLQAMLFLLATNIFFIVNKLFRLSHNSISVRHLV